MVGLVRAFVALCALKTAELPILQSRGMEKDTGEMQNTDISANQSLGVLVVLVIFSGMAKTREVFLTVTYVYQMSGEEEFA